MAQKERDASLRTNNPTKAVVGDKMSGKSWGMIFREIEDEMKEHFKLFAIGVGLNLFNLIWSHGFRAVGCGEEFGVMFIGSLIECVGIASIVVGIARFVAAKTYDTVLYAKELAKKGGSQ